MNNNQNEWLYRRIFGKPNDPGERFAIAFCMITLSYFTIRMFVK